MSTSSAKDGVDAASECSPDTQLLAEVFDYLKHPREDVRKMAIQSLAQQSKDDPQVAIFLASASHGAEAADTLMRFMHVVERSMVGDVLTLLVNCAAHGECTEALCRATVVRKAMRLLTEIELADGEDRLSSSSASSVTLHSSSSFLLGLKELTLMLLSNMTSSHVAAVEQLLQLEKEDMEGFYLDKLQQLYDRVSEGRGERSAEEQSDSAASSPAAASTTPTTTRDLRRWILQILLNITRLPDGQRLVLQSRDWREALCECLRAPHPRHRLLAAQCYRNCGCTQHPHYDLLLDSEALERAISRLVLPEPCAEVQLCLAEFVAYMLANEKGMARLEGINARRMLITALEAGEVNGGEPTHGEEKKKEQHVVGAPAASSPVLADNVREFIHKQILPYLDDIVDAYIAPGSDALD